MIKRKRGDREGNRGRSRGFVDSTKVVLGFRRKRKSISSDVRMILDADDTFYPLIREFRKGGLSGNTFCQWKLLGIISVTCMCHFISHFDLSIQKYQLSNVPLKGSSIDKAYFHVDRRF